MHRLCIRSIAYARTDVAETKQFLIINISVLATHLLPQRDIYFRFPDDMRASCMPADFVDVVCYRFGEA